MSRKNLIFFTKENRGGTVRYISHLLPALDAQFDTNIHFYKREVNGFKVKKSTFLSNTYPQSENFQLKKVFKTCVNLYKTIRIVLNLKQESTLVVLDIYTYILVCFSVFVLQKSNNIVYLVENNLFEIVKRKQSLIYKHVILFLYKTLLSRVDFFIFTCKSMERDYKRKLKLQKRKIAVLPLGVDLRATVKNNRDISSAELKLFDEASFKLISIMNFTPQKDFETLFRAFKKLTKTYSDLKLFIMGEGYLRAELLQKIKKMNMEDKIILLGWKKNVYVFLKKANIFVFSSLYEGFGLSLIEAMAAGLPVISSDTNYGPSDLLENQKNGLLYPVGNAKKLESCISKLMQDDLLRQKYIRNGKKRAHEFDASFINKKYLDFFINIYAQKENSHNS